ncbi:nitroreductase [Dethiosulfovibrio peptidovorans DSM 11002]|jgi:nitroreductase|uniref:Nitroreductase n=1 Tax=Dethiosulfovibrio peptidovorans DSM 11002 TaxID=469381 RepID=D2Z572_9BACT|nr:nitroreductase family protein [Dethiosulfovibrio peptidovorans]EFC90631.1 nitroreductase [Dethiosulfovibrio peptidovorans DSM 11002]
MEMDNKVVEAILARRSIRSYEDRPVEDDKVDLLVRCAAAAPSAGNGRPTHFVVIKDRGTLEDLSKVHPYGAMLAKAPLAVAICADTEKTDLSRRYWEQDCAAAMENLLIGARALGLGAVWLGVCHLSDGGTRIQEILGVPGNVPVMGLASVGYPAESKRPHSGDPGDRLHLERW